MRLITDILRESRNGQVVDYASREMAELVQAVGLTGKSGTLTITIKVSPDKGNKAGGTPAMNLSFDVKAKLPVPPLSDALFFANEEGDLTRTDPNQREMFGDAETYAQGRA